MTLLLTGLAVLVARAALGRVCHIIVIGERQELAQQAIKARARLQVEPL